jgi:hypothetical protein
MSKKYDKIMADMKAELEGATPEETPAAADPAQAPEPQPEPEPTHDPEPEPEPSRSEDPEPEPEPTPEPNGDPKGGKPHRDIPSDPLERATFSFKRQLKKEQDRHAAELADRDAKYNDLLKQVEDLKKQVAPKEKVKTREDFPEGEGGDDAYISYLAEQKVNAIMADRDAKDAERKAKEAEDAKTRQAEEDEVRQQREKWTENVNEAFKGDAERIKKFNARVSYCNRRGLGEVLDQCPVASDYIMNDPMGPMVLEKMINDKATFERVFNPRRTNPLAIYMELRAIESELVNETPEAKPAGAPAKPIPHLGKPGRQAGGSTMQPDMFSDPKAVKAWIKAHR